MSPAENLPKLCISRVIAASAEQLFDAWLDPQSLALWMRPNEIVRCAACTDPRVGGAFAILMYPASAAEPLACGLAAEGGEIRHQGVYRVIERPQRLVFTWHSPATEQRETLVTVEFRAQRAGTEVTITHEQLPHDTALQAHRGGWGEVLAKLAEISLAHVLPGMRSPVVQA